MFQPSSADTIYSRTTSFKKNSVVTARAALCIAQHIKLDLSRYLVPIFCHGLGELFRQDNLKAQGLAVQLSSALLLASSEAETVGQFFAFFLACLENKTNGAGGT